MNSVIKNHKIEDHVMSLEPWLWNRSSEKRIPWFSTSNSSAGSIHLVPPPLADRLSSPPPWCTFWGSHRTHTTMACIHTPSIWLCGARPPIPGTDDNNVYDTDTWRNINGDWGVSAVLQHYYGGNVTIAHYLYFVCLCLLLALWPVDCSSPVDCISFVSLYLHNSGFTYSFLEYSLWNIPLYY